VRKVSKVIVEKQDQIAFVTLNRPEQLNCFDFDTLIQLEEILNRLASDTDVRAVIFTGSGEKAFSAGADLKERRTLSEKEVRRNVSKIRDVFTMVAELPQPTISAINGYAFGGGFELALACDFRYAAEGVQLGLTEVSWAIIPAAGGTQRLSRLIGISRAKEMILTARKITAEQAEQWGILNGVVTKQNLMNKAIQLAEEILKNGPLAVIQAKHAINYGSEVDLRTGLAMESKAYEIIIPTSDRVEALEAFNEKRPPRFKGK
jgi:enoyl-CoA hydratase